LAYGTYQITGKEPLPQRSTTTFRLVDFEQNSYPIGFGIITESRKQSVCSGFKGEYWKPSSCYWTSKYQLGQIIVDGEVKTDW